MSETKGEYDALQRYNKMVDHLKSMSASERYLYLIAIVEISGVSVDIKLSRNENGCDENINFSVSGSGQEAVSQPSRADAEVINGLRLKVEELEKRADMHARINREVAEALGLPTGESWHDLGERVEKMHDALQRIADWPDAYLEMFPEPDFGKVDELLKAGGQSLSCVTASNMRHVVKRVAEIAREAQK